LQNGAPWLKSQGILVYATCTLSRLENEAVIEKFLAEHPNFVLEDVSPCLPDAAKSLGDTKGFFHTWPPDHGLDGFFVARMRKIQ